MGAFTTETIARGWAQAGPFAPKLLVLACAILFVLAAVTRKQWATRAAIPASAAIVASAALINLDQWERTGAYFGGWLLIDGLSRFVDLVLLAAATLVMVGSAGRFARRNPRADFFAMLFFSLCGATILSSTTNLPGIFLGIELTALPAFALVAVQAKEKRAYEAAVKYFIAAVFASALLLYGFSLIYGTTGTVRLSGLGGIATTGLLVVGIAFALAGFGFKLAVFPFHFWVPDTFEATHPQVAAYLAIVPKIAGITALVRIATALSGQRPGISWTLAIVAAITMTFGNLAALRQDNIKRMLAYSGIAHAGYALVGLGVGTAFGSRAAVAYFALYGLGVVGAFLVVAATTQSGIGETVGDFAGLGSRNRFLAATMALFMLSLVGIPLFAGFYGKFLVFAGAVKAGVVWLAIVGLLNSVISFGYYGKVIRQMYLVGTEEAKRVRTDMPLALAIGVAAVGVVAVGVAPGILTAFLK